MLTALLTQYGSKIDSIAIGNEVDVYLSANPTEWQPYATFYGQASALIHSHFPSIRVGVTSTFGGAIDATNGPLISALNAVSDMFMMNYYPLNANFTPLDPSVVSADFAKILAAGPPGKPILLQEVGYPTSTALGSSEQMQAQFVTNVFSEWMKAGDKIEYLSFFLLHDDTPANCAADRGPIQHDESKFCSVLLQLGLEKFRWNGQAGMAGAENRSAGRWIHCSAMKLEMHRELELQCGAPSHDHTGRPSVTFPTSFLTTTHRNSRIQNIQIAKIVFTGWSAYTGLASDTCGKTSDPPAIDKRYCPRGLPR